MTLLLNSLMNKLILSAILAICVSELYSQSSITGIVVDKTSKANIEFANVQLLSMSDTSVVKSTVTGKQGKFSINGFVAGKYVLQSSFIGYEKNRLAITVSKNQKLNVGLIELAFVSGTTKEVTVTTKRSMLNTGIDRKVYDVSQDIMAQSGAASDILRNIPSVEVDIEGNLSLRGSGDVMILINGRPSPLMGKTRAEVLQQLPANSIERIEVITNPSARYRPDGTSGIIISS